MNKSKGTILKLKSMKFYFEEPDGMMISDAFFATLLFVQVNCGKILPPGAVSKEFHIQADAVMSFDPTTEIPGSQTATGYLRNLGYTTDYPHFPDRAVTFPGLRTSYMFLPNADGAFDGTDMGSWWFYIYPDPDFTYGSIIEYESTCPGGLGMSIRFKNNKIEFSGTLSNGNTFYGLSSTHIPSGQWTYVGVMWHEVYPELRVNVNGESLESAAIVTLNAGDKFVANSTIRIGASFGVDIPPFKGRIGCLLYQKGYYLKSKLTPENYCDPNLREPLFPLESVTDTTLTGPLTSGCNAITVAPTSTTVATTQWTQASPFSTSASGSSITIASTTATTPTTTPLAPVFAGFSNRGVLQIEDLCIWTKNGTGVYG